MDDNPNAIRRLLTEAVVSLTVYTMATTAILSLVAVVGSKWGFFADVDATAKFLIMSGIGVMVGMSLHASAAATYIVRVARKQRSR